MLDFQLKTYKASRNCGYPTTIRPLGPRAAPSDTAAPSFNTADLYALSPRSPRPGVSAAPRPPQAHLWAAVLASSTPAPCIHVRTAFIPATMGSSFILLPLLWMLSWMPNIKTHLHTVAICLSRSLSSLSLYPPLLGSLLFFSLSPCLPSSCVCLIALSEEQSGVVYFTWRLVARVFLKVNKRCDMWKEKGELSASRVSCTSCQRLQKKKRGKAAAVKMNTVRAMKGEAQDERLH